MSASLYCLLVVLLMAPVIPALHQRHIHKDADLNYGFQVHDPTTFNFQERQESHHNGVIKGFYSLLEADGSLRLVTYTADKSGFRALVAKQQRGAKISATVHT